MGKHRTPIHLNKFCKMRTGSGASLKSSRKLEMTKISILSEYPAKLQKQFYSWIYYIGFAPFRIVYTDGKYIVHRSSVQTCFAAMNTIFVLYAYFVDVIPGTSDILSQQLRPSSFFRLMVKISSFVYILHSLKLFWFSSENFARYLNVLQQQVGQTSDLIFGRDACRMAVYLTVSGLTILLLCEGAVLLCPSVSLSQDPWTLHCLKVGWSTFHQTKYHNTPDTYFAIDYAKGLLGIIFFIPW